MGRRGRPPHADILTPREWEVLALLREGLTNEEIAERLGIGFAGAKYHVSEILSKLGVSSREEAAGWRPDDRPRWTAATALAPVFWLRHTIGASVPARAVALGLALVVAAGGGLLVWGLARTEENQVSGTVQRPPAVAADILECLHTATFAEDRQSVSTLDPASTVTQVAVNGDPVDERASGAILSLLRDAEPAVFGVRATTARIGEPGRTGGIEIRTYFGTRSLALRYVRPGNVAPFGLLFDPAAVDSWEYVGMISPAGYAQQVCTVPPQLDQLMAELGYEGNEPEGILETRLVPLDRAQRETSIGRLVVQKGDQAPRTIEVPSLDEIEGQEDGKHPLEPYVGEPLTIEVWYSGIDPFPEAVRPAIYHYYASDASGSDTGVLVLLEPGAVANGTLGSASTPPSFASPALNQVLREAGLTDAFD